MKRLAALTALLALSLPIWSSVCLPCLAQADKGDTPQGTSVAKSTSTGTIIKGTTATPLSPAQATALRAQYEAFDRQLTLYAVKHGVGNAYDKFCTRDYVFVPMDKQIKDRHQFIADAKAGKPDIPLTAKDLDDTSPYDVAFEVKGNLLTATTKGEQSYTQDVNASDGTIVKDAKVKIVMNLKETYLRSSNGKLMLKKTDMTDYKLYANGVLIPH